MNDIVTAFKGIDAELRVVALLGSKTWEIEYIRDELEETYTDADFEEAYRDLMANQISSADFSQVGPMGDLIGQMYYLEEVIVFQFPSSRYEGVFVSFDQAESFPVGTVFQVAEELRSFAGN